ncbi:hypothetical protein N7478_013186 [Penicillium angulare]|uniref:uncharacterized protein n=1 Tax=Penicillium angulare TaxID=116970 RepID=UPI002540919E|nr:uncharacterized protein N7478_013186 [Penicillium angulare]KAJ5257082.1 hypothetical protein N7478_013186 [Penicillium angulare]
MQSFLEQRRIRKRLEQQIVVRRKSCDDVWTHERRYWYPEGGGIQSEQRYTEEEAPAARRREHGQQTMASGPSMEPRHSVRSHLGQEEDIEAQDRHPALNIDPFTINTRDTLGTDVDMMVTGVESQRVIRDVTGSIDGSTIGSDVNADEKEKIVIVTYEGDYDPADPHNWSFIGRCACTILVSLLGAIVLWSSTIDTTALVSTRKLFHTSFELETVPIALFLICLGFGALVAAPISEIVGRNPIYISCLPLFMLFNMGAGLAQNVGQRSVCRALAGLFGSAPLVCSAAAIVDLWSVVERNYAFPFFSIMAFLGAVVGPLPGSVIVWAQSTSWRYVDWVTIMFCGFLLALTVLFLPETYSPVILHWKAKQLRRLTNDDRYHSPLEFKATTFGKRLRRALSRPIVLLCTEPIIIILSAYLGIIFIILYTFSAGFESVFQKIYKLNPGQGGATFLSLATGIICCGPLVLVSQRLVRRDILRARERGQCRPGPEFNLYMSIFGAPFIPIALFWMGWTARPSISMWCPIVAAGVFGFGVTCVFISSYQYVAAAFEEHPASALASLQMFRLVTAGVMAVLAQIMYDKLKVDWTMTLLGGIATVFMPVPYVLYFYGCHIRKWSLRASAWG